MWCKPDLWYLVFKWVVCVDGLMLYISKYARFVCICHVWMLKVGGAQCIQYYCTVWWLMSLNVLDNGWVTASIFGTIATNFAVFNQVLRDSIPVNMLLPSFYTLSFYLMSLIFMLVKYLWYDVMQQSRVRSNNRRAFPLLLCSLATMSAGKCIFH